MPYASSKQRKYMHAAAQGKARKGGMSKKDALRFIAHSQGRTMAEQTQRMKPKKKGQR